MWQKWNIVWHMVDINAVIAVAHMYIICPYAWSKMTPPLINCILSDAVVCAMPNTQWSLLLFVNVVHLRLKESLLDDIPSCSTPDWGRDCSTATYLIKWGRCCLLEKSYSEACLICMELLTFKSVYIKQYAILNNIQQKSETGVKSKLLSKMQYNGCL